MKFEMLLMQFCFVISMAISAEEAIQREGVLIESDQVQQWLDKGLAAYRIDDLMGSISWLSKAAAKNHPYAQAMLGYIYVRSGEIEQAVPLFEKAAKQGDEFALYELSTLYAEGYGVAKSNDKAVELLLRAIKKDYYPAYFQLASAYELGKLGLETNTSKALSYYQQASDNNYTSAIYRLITAYQNGELGLSIDDDKAKALKDLIISNESDKQK